VWVGGWVVGVVRAAVVVWVTWVTVFDELLAGLLLFLWLPT
jgi:hypothetical protein